MSASSESSLVTEVESVRPGEEDSITELLKLAHDEQVERIRALDAQLSELPELLRKRERLIALIQRIRIVLNLPLMADNSDHWWDPGRRRNPKVPLLVGRSTPHEATQPTEAKL